MITVTTERLHRYVFHRGYIFSSSKSVVEVKLKDKIISVFGSMRLRGEV
jgi:hypothetical protein